MRAFIAVDLSEDLRTKIEEIQGEFVKLPGGLKFVDAKQAHLTVKFLGNIPDDSVKGIKDALAEISQNPFDIELQGVGFFPAASLEKARKVRVIWIGIEKGKEELNALQGEVESRMNALGFPVEKRFSVHITLCRVKKPLKTGDEIGRVLNRIAKLKDVAVGKMLVEELKLKKSTLTPKGPIYEDVYVKRLGE